MLSLTAVAQLMDDEGHDDDDIEKELKLKNLKDLEALQLKQTTERENKLKSMLRRNSTPDLADNDMSDEAKHERNVMVLINTRYTVCRRIRGMSSRVAYRLLEAAYDEKRLDILKNAASEDDRIVCTALSALAEGTLTAVQSLSITLQSAYKEKDLIEDTIREKWHEDLSKVDIDHEITILKAQYNTEMLKLKNESQKYEILINKNCENENLQRRNSNIQSNSKLIFGSYNLSDQDMSEKTELTDKKIANSLTCSKSILAEDQRILNQEEKGIELFISMALTWGPKVDAREQQGLLHQKMIEGMYYVQDIQMRLCMAEFNLRAEVIQMRAGCDLHQRKAGILEVELLCQNLQDSAAENGEIMRVKLVQKHAQLVQLERERQDDVVLDYENERCLALCADIKRSVLSRIQVEVSYLTIKSELEEVLNEKKSSIQADYDGIASEETRLLASEQVEAETKREECELKAAYSSISVGFLISERFLGELTGGVPPSVQYTQDVLLQGHLKEIEYLSCALHNDYMRRKCIKKIIAANTQKAYEERRLIQLGRPAEDLVLMYEDIESRLQKDLQVCACLYVNV